MKKLLLLIITLMLICPAAGVAACDCWGVYDITGTSWSVGDYVVDFGECDASPCPRGDVVIWMPGECGCDKIIAECSYIVKDCLVEISCGDNCYDFVFACGKLILLPKDNFSMQRREPDERLR